MLGWGPEFKFVLLCEWSLKPFDMKEGVHKVTVLGAGTLGLEISLQSAISGYQVTLYDISEANLRAAEQRQTDLLHMMNEIGYVDASENGRVLGRLSRTTDPAEAAREADLVCESVTENVEIKSALYRQFSGLWPEHTILTTNSSTLLPSMFARTTGRPEKFMALHFHTPTWASNVTDIMPHAGTTPETVRVVRDFAVSLRQVPITLQKESPGYVFNAMLVPMLDVAAGLVVNEVVTPEEVDRAFMGVMHTTIGPMGILDLVGLDTFYHVKLTSLALGGKPASPELQKIIDLVKGMMDEGRLGMKTGRGFYQYPHPAFANADFVARGSAATANG